MRVYNFVIISIALMFTFWLIGIDTGSSKVLNAFYPTLDTNETLNIDAGVTSAPSDSTFSLRNYTNWYTAFGIGLALLMLSAVLTTVTGGLLKPDIYRGLVSAFMWIIFLAIGYDFLSIVNYVYSLAGISWQWALCWVIIVPYMGGFMIAIISFIGGAD